MGLTGRLLVAAMCVAQVANLLPHVVVPAVMAQHLMPLWSLSASEAGIMASGYALGYMLAVPVLATLTDRIDARLILLLGSAVSGLATIAFGLLADGLLSATLIWSMAGAGFAGAYMPGLKALTDRMGSGDISRGVTLYTSSFSLGVGLSFLVAQLIADAYGWRAAFVVTGLAPLVMVAVAFALEPVHPPRSSNKLLDFRPVFRNRPAMGFILGYAVHCFEVYGMRTWIVAFWTFVIARHGGDVLLSAVMVSVLVSVMAMPASIVGNEIAIRVGRHRAIVILMLLAGVSAIVTGVWVDASPWMLLVLLTLYSFAVPADSGALTSGMAASAEPAFRGATMALHSTFGFAMSALGSWSVGVAIDAFGGPMSEGGWRAAFFLLAVPAVLGPLALMWSRRGAAARDGPAQQ